jgi:hypothetical protein
MNPSAPDLTGLFIALALIGLSLFGFWLWAVLQCANAQFKQPVDKVVWILILIFLGPLGALLFATSGRKHAQRSGESDKWVV